jgi:hypothetical protein
MLDDLCKSPVSLKLKDGKTYQVSPLTQGDLGELLRAIQFQEFTAIVDAPGVTDDVRRETMRECAKNHIVLGSPEFYQGFQSPFAQSQAALLSLKHKHPDMTLADVDAMLPTDVSLINEVCSVITNPYEEDSTVTVKVKDENGVETGEEKTVDLPGAQKKMQNLRASNHTRFV